MGRRSFRLSGVAINPDRPLPCEFSRPTIFLCADMYAVDFAACPEKLPRPDSLYPDNISGAQIPMSPLPIITHWNTRDEAKWDSTIAPCSAANSTLPH